MGLWDKLMPPGKMTMVPEKFNYTAGETVKGKLTLTTKKPIKATALKIRLMGTQKSSSRTMSGGHIKSSSNTKTIFNFEMPLDGEKEYNNTEYPFEIKIPKDILQRNQMPDIGGGLGTALKAAKYLTSGQTSSTIYWYLIGDLDIPGGRDISKKVQINIT